MEEGESPGSMAAFVPKEKDSIRTISLLNVEGKIFMAVPVKRLSEYIVNNNYINTSVQRTGILSQAACNILAS